MIYGSCQRAGYRRQDIAGVMTSSSVAFDQDMLHSPFRNASEVVGRSRVCTGSSNNPDTFQYPHFLPLMLRTISLRIS
jgi:hypothetical protein